MSLKCRCCRSAGDLRPLADRQLFGLHRRKMDLGHEIPQRPEQFRDHHLGSRGHRGISRWVELEKPDLTGGVTYRETRA